MMMKSISSKFALTLAAASVLAGCSAFRPEPVSTRIEPTYKEAGENAFLNSSKDAVAKLLGVWMSTPSARVRCLSPPSWT
ncbi:outer membrane protein assembly factor BamD [Diaphorobacter aerolatus]|uniref:hypothetical protein n=1 Tax=Diaphorobacter aerolatus TaxID=1288495 RepID=UPI001D00EEA8|nr:hypothetical protein [Diaphorobacter aerolatus]